MKIIFDSEEQKEAFERDIFLYHCPVYFGIERDVRYKLCELYNSCDDCWRDHLEMEVKNE